MKIAYIAAWMTAAFGLLALPASATETLFAEVDLNTTVGCAVPGPFSSNTNGATLGVSCGDFTSVGAAAAVVDHGRVGASTIATDVTQGINVTAQASWQDDNFLITGTPGHTGTTPASLNFVFEGGFGGLGAAGSDSTVFMAVEINGASFSVFAEHADNGDSCRNSGPIDLCARFDDSVTLGTVFTTPVLNLPVNTPFEIGYFLVVNSDAIFPAASSDADFIHTLGFASGGPVLNFGEPGFTVNAGNYILDNAYIVPVDEPGAPMLLALGLGGLVLRLRAGRLAAGAT